METDEKKAVAKIAPAQYVYDTPVRFTRCFHMSIGYSIVRNGRIMIDCALCNDVKHSTFRHLIGSLSIIEGGNPHESTKTKLQIVHYDDQPYYGDEQILCFRCSQSKTLHDVDCRCRNVHLLGHGCKHMACSQYFYSTIADLCECDNATRQHVDLSCCWHMHISEHYPIYKCIVVLELMSNMRWNYPIPVKGGLRAAYNPEMNIVILCVTQSNWRSQMSIAREAFEYQGTIPTIYVIDELTVNTHWPGDAIPQQQRRYDATDLAFRGIRSLASCLAQLIHYDGPSRLANIDFVQTLHRTLFEGRILVSSPNTRARQPPPKQYRMVNATYMRNDYTDPILPDSECDLKNLRTQIEDMTVAADVSSRKK